MKQYFVNFYQKDFLRIKQLHFRDFKEAIVLLFFKEAQLLSIILNCPEQTYSKVLSNFAQFLNVSKIYPNICWNNENKNCQIYFSFGLAILIFAISIILLALVNSLYSFKTDENHEKKAHQISRKKQIQKISLSKSIAQNQISVDGKSNIWQRPLMLILSIFLQTFEYLIFQPFFYLLLKNITTSINFYYTNQTSLNILATVGTQEKTFIYLANLN